MQEQFTGGSRAPRLSPYQIRKMKENMRKVPEIQKRAEQYHQSESSAIEKELDNYLQSESTKTSQKVKQKPEEKVGLWQKIKTYLFR